MKIKQIMSSTSVIPAGKIKCYITGKYRADKPEEHVRQRMARSIVEEYGYSKTDIELEFKLKLGSATKRADIVVFKEGTPHKIENIRIIIEAKKETIKPTNKDNGIDQLMSYMSATPNSKYGLWVGSEIKAYERLDKMVRTNIDDIDINGKEAIISVKDATDYGPKYKVNFKLAETGKVTSLTVKTLAETKSVAKGTTKSQMQRLILLNGLNTI